MLTEDDAIQYIAVKKNDHCGRELNNWIPSRRAEVSVHTQRSDVNRCLIQEDGECI